MEIRDRIVELRRVKAADLVPHPENWRVHPPEQRAALAGALAEVGWADAVLARELDDGRLQIIDGHLRADVAEDAMVPVLVLDVNEEEAKKLLLTLDPMAAMATANKAVALALAEAVDIKSPALQALVDAVAPADVSGETDPDDVPDAREEPVTQAGDLWVLGDHRLLCGDSTEADDVARLVRDDAPFMMVTDPPYGVGYASLVASRSNQKQGGWSDIENDELPPDELEDLLTSSLQCPSAKVAFVWHPPGAMRWCFWRALESNGWRISQEIVWVKNSLVFGRADYQWRHEPCMYAKREGAGRQEDRTQTTVWEIDKQTKANHPTQKPVECMARPIRNHGTSGDIVYDPFVGSGTTIIACEQERRRCFSMELEPRYVDVAVRRWENVTGQAAERVPA